MRPSAVYRPSEQARYRVCQCEPAAVSHGQSCRRKRERQTSLGAEKTRGLHVASGLHLA